MGGAAGADRVNAAGMRPAPAAQADGGDPVTEVPPHPGFDPGARRFEGERIEATTTRSGRRETPVDGEMTSRIDTREERRHAP